MSIVSKPRGVLIDLSNGYISFWCPGCEEYHSIEAARWHFDGNYEAPTLSPSILVTSGHYMTKWKDSSRCYCNFNGREQIPGKDPDFDCVRCHSFVKSGMIEFLSDCLHKLAGTTHRLFLPG